jgi:hypothetical protein
MLAAAPDATAQEISDALTTTAKQSIFATPDADGHDLEYGWGIVQPAAALAALLGTDGPSPVVIPPPTNCRSADGCPPALAIVLLLVRRRGRRSSAA